MKDVKWATRKQCLIYEEFIGKEGNIFATILLLNKNVMMSGTNKIYTNDFFVPEDEKYPNTSIGFCLFVDYF